MNAMWSGQQREWLQAMGYRVLALAGSEAVEPLHAPAERVEADAAPSSHAPMPVSAPVSAPISARRPVMRELPAEPVDVAGSPPASTPAASLSGAERRLQRALLRATGQRTRRAAEAMLASLQIDLAGLHDDAVAKRALWVRLRALRRGSQRQ